MQRIPSLFVAIVVCSCSGKTIDAGSNHLGVEGGTGASMSNLVEPGDAETFPPWSASGCTDEPQLQPIVGAWEGTVGGDTFVNGHAFASGSDAVRLDITHASAGGVCGTVTLGSGMVSPPWTYLDAGPGAISTTPPKYIEGFAMTMIQGELTTDSRLQFRATTRELWKPICEMQTPYQLADNEYSCFPGNGWSRVGMGPCIADTGMVVDCTVAALCRTVCYCLASGCTAPAALNELSFDLHLIGSQASGTTSVGEVTLTKQP